MPAFVIKIIICLAMLGDHLGAVFPSIFPFGFRVAGRIAFPVFAFFVAEGCAKTRNIYKYMLRLGLFALISEIPFDLAFNQFGYIEGVSVNWLEYTNALYTLFLGCAAVAVIKEAPKKRNPFLLLLPVILVLPVITYVPDFGLRGSSFIFGGIRPGTDLWWVPRFVARLLFLATVAAELALCKFLPNAQEPAPNDANADGLPAIASSRRDMAVFAMSLVPAFAICCAASVLGGDYGLAGAAWVVLYYAANTSNRLSRCLVCVAGALYVYGQQVVETYFDTITDAWKTEVNIASLLLFIGALGAAALLALYNGKRGKPVKWAFYAFYPAHLALIVIAVYAMLLNI